MSSERQCVDVQNTRYVSDDMLPCHSIVGQERSQDNMNADGICSVAPKPRGVS